MLGKRHYGTLQVVTSGRNRRALMRARIINNRDNDRATPNLQDSGGDGKLRDMEGK